MTNNEKAKLHITRPTDRSLEAYKKWVSGLVQKVNPKSASTMTEEDWKKAHKEFWDKVDSQK